MACHHNVQGLFGERWRPYVLFATKVSLILPLQQSERGARAYCSPTPRKEGVGEGEQRDGWEAGEERDKF